MKKILDKMHETLAQSIAKNSPLFACTRRLLVNDRALKISNGGCTYMAKSIISLLSSEWTQ